MKLIPYALCLVCSCLAGCMDPQTAAKMFGLEQPEFHAKRTKDLTEVKSSSNAKGKWTLKKFDPVTGHLIEESDLNLNLRPDQTIDSQGNLVTAMTPAQVAEIKENTKRIEIGLNFFGQRLDHLVSVFAAKPAANPLPVPVEPGK